MTASDKGLDSALERPGGSMVAVGIAAKALGLKGEVLVKLTTDRLERVSPGSILWAGCRSLRGSSCAAEDVEHEAGKELLLEVESSRAHGKRWAVRFKGIEDREAASRIGGRVLLAMPLEVPGVLWVRELVGREVRDRSGAVLGTVEAVEANPASDLLVLDSGAVVPLCFLRDSSPVVADDRSSPASRADGVGDGCVSQGPRSEVVDERPLVDGRGPLVVELPDGLLDACSDR